MSSEPAYYQIVASSVRAALTLDVMARDPAVARPKVSRRMFLETMQTKACRLNQTASLFPVLSVLQKCYIAV